MTDDDMEQIIIDAGSAYTAGRYEEALKLYDTAIEARPSNAILFANKAAILLRLDRAELAVHSADRAIELDPNWAKAYYRRGEALRRLNSLLPAVVALSEGAALGPSNNLIVDALIDVAQQFFDNFSLKRLENIGLERDLFTVLTMIGQELASKRHLREATTVLTRALSLSSPSRRLRESALSALASVHFSLGEYHKATFYYEKQLDIRLQQEGHSPADVYENVATSAELTGNYALALSHRKNRLKHLNDIDAVQERLRIASLLCSLSRIDAALDEYKDVERLAEVLDEQQRMAINTRIRIGRGIIFSLMGDTSKCIEELSGVDPPSEEEAIKVADAIVACHIKEGSIQDAIEYLNELLKTSTENRHQKLFGHTCFLLAREHIRNGRPHSAIRLAKRILRLARTTSDSCLERAGLQLMATIYEEQDDLQSASVLLQQYLEVSGVTVVESVNALLRLAAIADRTSADPLMALTKAVELADVSGNLDLVALARSALLRHLAQKDANDQHISKLLALQKELLKSTISVTSRSLIFEDMAMCEKGETSGMDELLALEQSLTEAQEAGNIRRELFLLEKLGDCLLSMDRFNDAEGFYQQLLTLAQQLRAVTHIKRAYMKMAILAAGFGKWMQCAELARRALTLSRFFHDHTSKAHMMLLIGRSELDRGNYDMAQSVFTKAIEVCKEHGIHATAAIARRFMVDLAIFRHQKDITVLEHIRDHLALFDYEFDDRAKLKSMIRLGRYCAELDHFTSLKIVSSAKKLLCGPCVEEQPDLLLECFDVYVTLEMLDEAWRILMKIIDSPSLSTEDLKKISKRLLVFPLRRRAITIVGLVERGLDDTNTLSQLAYFVPKFTLQVLSEKNDPLAEMISHIQLDDWCSALSCAEAVFAGQSFPPVADGLFGRKRTDEAISQVLLISRWNIDRVLHWPDLSTLDETSFCCFFDVAYQRILHDGVTLSPSSRAHLHTLMLQGDFDLTHEAAGAVEKIICAANTGCGEMIAMWYDELIEEFLHEDIEGVEIFPFSSKELELKVATVIFALEQETFEKQLQILESSKWLLDKRLFSKHGRHLEQPPLVAVPTDPFMYVYGVARVQLTWTALGGGQVLTSFSRTTEELSFLEECLLRCLQQRGIPERNWNGVKVDELFVNDRHDTGVNPKFYVVADEYLPIDSSGHLPKGILNLCRGEEGPSRLSEGLTALSSCFLTIVDAFDRLLHPDICLSVERTPPLVVSRGTLSFTLIRTLFLNGTVAVVELDEAAGDDEIEELVNKLRSSPNPSEVLSKYCCYVKSRTALSYWPDLAEHLSIALHKSSTTSPKADEQSDRAGEDDVGKPMRAMLQETVRINNLWMKPLQFRSQKETTEEFKLSKADETALVKLCEDLLRYTKGEATAIISNESGKDRGEGDANRQKRRRKKQAEKPVSGYMSDGADVGRRIKAHVRSQSDAVSRSTSSVLWPAVE